MGPDPSQPSWGSMGRARQASARLKREQTKEHRHFSSHFTRVKNRLLSEGKVLAWGDMLSGWERGSCPMFSPPWPLTLSGYDRGS